VLFEANERFLGRTESYERKLLRSELTPSRKRIVAAMERDIEHAGGYPPGSFGVYSHLVKELPACDWEETLAGIAEWGRSNGMKGDAAVDQVLNFVGQQRVYLKREILLLYIPIFDFGRFNIVFNDIRVLPSREDRLLVLGLLTGEIWLHSIQNQTRQ
jgi:hypothetical protein